MSGTFLLGVGCQKGGTAWLHRYLAESPDCEAGFRKEYHVWDGVDLDAGARFATRAREQAALGDADAALLAQFYDDPEAYFDYFAGLLDAGPETRLTADITPAYAQLSIRRLAAIREGFERRGVRPVAVFLMRDPVERLWSAMRMYQKRKPAKYPGPAERWALSAHATAFHEERTRYDLTIERLEAAFGPERIWYGFYERLFDEEVLRDLNAFLGIEHHTPDFARRVNASPARENARLSDDTVRTIARHYRPVYDAVARRFGIDDLGSLWPNARFLDG